jgi:hypothetical protein
METRSRKNARFGLPHRSCSAKDALRHNSLNNSDHSTSGRQHCLSGHWGDRMMKRFSTYMLLSFLTLFCMMPLAKAQRTAASLSGTVTDSSGAAIIGAQVTAIETQTGVSVGATSNQQGVFVISNLQAGSYKLNVKAAGFGEQERTGIEIQVGQSRAIDFSMKVGADVQAVEVSTELPLVNTIDQTVSIAVTPEFTELMPLNGRNVASLLAVAPDTSSHSPNASAYSGQNVTRPEAKGEFITGSGASRENSTTYYLDGGLNEDPYTQVANVFPNPDAVKEFTADTNSYSAKFGGRGGAIVNAITRDGTNQFHGTAFEYLRNGYVNAVNYFSSSDSLKRNQYGFTLGGPVRRDKTFAFGSFQRTTYRYGTTANTSYGPTQAQLNGDWSSSLSSSVTELKNPLTGQVFTGGQVSTSLYSPISTKFLAMIPSGDPTTGKLTYVTRTMQNDNQYVLRVDHNLSSKSVLSGTYLWDQYENPNVADSSNVLTGGAGVQWTSQHATLNYVYRFTNNLVMTAQVSESRVVSSGSGNASFKSMGELGANWPDWSPSGAHEEGLYVGGWFSAYWVGLQRVPRHEEEILNNWTWVKGRHTLDFGGEMPFYQSVAETANTTTGYQGWWCENSGSDALDFMLGANCYYQQYTPTYVSPRGKSIGIYANDSWRLSPRLTVNLGLRWEPWMPWKDGSVQKIGAQINMDAYNNDVHSTRWPNLPAGFLMRGDAGVPDALSNSSYNRFDPRVGLAWNVFGNGTTSLRAGFGIYHDQFFARMFNQITSTIPYNAGVLVEDSTVSAYDPYQASPYNGTIPDYTFPLSSNTSFSLPLSTVVGFSPSFKPPTTMQWNITIEQQLPWGVMWRTGYEASESYHMFDSRDINTKLSGVRPMAAKGFGSSVIVDESIGTASYNALIVSAEKRMSHGLSFIGGYRWSKCLDLGSTSTMAFNEFTDARNPGIDRGVCNSNLTHQLKTTGIWKLPSVQNFGAIGNQTLSGWTLSGMMTWHGGFPFTVSAGNDANADGNSNDRANLVGDPALASNRSHAAKISQWFNTAAFANPVNSTGNTGRNFLNGPGYANLDAALIRSFKMPFGFFRDSQRVDFRTEAFNLFNHANYLNPDSKIGDTAFGRIQSAQSPRILQFALKYVF